MKKLLISSSMLVFVGALVVGATGAFFNDTEASSGNTFAAGAIDLKIDNHSYYDGNECKETAPQSGVFEWSGTHPFPQPGTPCDTSWDLADLTVQKFFNFTDVKPGDNGEDTISLHVDNNDAYLCATVKLTSNDDNGLTEPESLVDSTDGPGNGELASNINFIWWADDGDNVLESNEHVISEGPIGALGTDGSITVPLADSATNIWTGTGGPAPGGITQYIAKAWCFGKLTPTPVAPGNNDPAVTPGYTCDGSLLNNSTQTDSLTADVTFTAVQARNNPGYLCVPQTRQSGTLVVNKTVVNNNGGNNVVSDFHFFVDDGFVSQEVLSGSSTVLSVGAYNVSEAGSSGYQASFSGDCDQFGNVTITASTTKTCNITNTELPAHITLIKNVTGTPPLASNTQFGLTIDGHLTPTGASVAVTSNAPHVINEAGRAGYSFVNITGDPKCPATLGGSVTLDEGETITCTITNQKNPQ